MIIPDPNKGHSYVWCDVWHKTCASTNLSYKMCSQLNFPKARTEGQAEVFSCESRRCERREDITRMRNRGRGIRRPRPSYHETRETVLFSFHIEDRTVLSCLCTQTKSVLNCPCLCTLMIYVRTGTKTNEFTRKQLPELIKRIGRFLFHHYNIYSEKSFKLNN